MVRRIIVACSALVIVVCGQGLESPPAGAVDRRSPAMAQMVPTVTPHHASPAQRRRLGQALTRFRAVGLPVPDLNVFFSNDEADCRGHLGLFSSARLPWRVYICSPLEFVYEHELAHAWERATLTDAVRSAFIDLRGHTTWSQPDVPWNERGVEDAAMVIQQGLSGLPLPPSLSDEHRERLAAFSLLTGRPAPRLLEWCDLRRDREICPRRG